MYNNHGECDANHGNNNSDRKGNGSSDGDDGCNYNGNGDVISTDVGMMLVVAVVAVMVQWQY